MSWCSELTKLYLESQGFHVESVEIPGVRGRTKDFMGMWDELAWDREGRLYLVQSTDRNNIRARQKKIMEVLSDPKSDRYNGMAAYLACESHKAEIWGWNDKNVVKRKVLSMWIDSDGSVHWEEAEA